MMDSRILDPPHAQFGGSLGGMVGFPYHLSHHHVYELAGHQLQSASAVPFSIDGLLNGSCTASVGNSNPLLSSGCGMNGDNQHYKLTGKTRLRTSSARSPLNPELAAPHKNRKTGKKQRQDIAIQVILWMVVCLKRQATHTHTHMERERERGRKRGREVLLLRHFISIAKAEDAPRQKK